MSYTEQLAAFGRRSTPVHRLSPYNPDWRASPPRKPIRSWLRRGQAKVFDESPFWTPVTLPVRTYHGQDRISCAGRAPDAARHKQQIRTYLPDRQDDRRAQREFADPSPGVGTHDREDARVRPSRNLVPGAFTPARALLAEKASSVAVGPHTSR